MDIDTTQSRSSWSRAVLIKRVLWWFFGFLFLSIWGRRLSWARVAALRLFGARITGRVLICGGTKVWMPWNLVMEEFSAVGLGVEIYNFAEVRIGKHATVSQGSYLCTGSHDYTHPHMPLVMRPIVIGDGAWICARVSVGPGVTIGDGAVAGLGSVVVRNLPPWMICAGNPCVPLKPRVIKPLDQLPPVVDGAPPA